MRTVARGAPWMNEAERRQVRLLAGKLRHLFLSRGVPETPLLALRGDDLCVSLLLAKRAEEALAFHAGAPGLEDTDKGAAGRAAVAALETAGRARERLRKAMKELEDACAKMGTPLDTGVADSLKSLMKRGAGTAEAAGRDRAEDPPPPEEAETGG